MVASCIICKENFEFLTLNHFQIYCDHVSKCIIRSDNFLVKRFTCPFCDISLQKKQSFKAHILKKHCDKICIGPTEYSHGQNKRRRSEKFSSLIMFF